MADRGAYREQTQARAAFKKSRAAERVRVEPKRAYLGDGAGNLTTTRAQMYYVRIAGSDDAVVEARLPSTVWIPLLDGLAIWLRQARENGQTYYEITGEAPGTNWIET